MIYYPSSTMYSSKSLKKFRKQDELESEYQRSDQIREEKYREQNRQLKDQLDNALRDLSVMDTQRRQAENKLNQSNTLHNDMLRDNQTLQAKVNDQQTQIKIIKVETAAHIKSLNSELDTYYRDNHKMEQENKQLKLHLNQIQNQNQRQIHDQNEQHPQQLQQQQQQMYRQQPY